MHEREKFDDYKNYIGQLENEYLTTFEKIEIYINDSTKLNILEKNDCFLQILDSFLSGQAEGKLVTDITGTNLKQYCDNMIYGESIHIYKASRVCSIILGALAYVAFINFFIRFCHVIRLKDSSIIFQPMNFGIAEVILGLSYIYGPKLIFFITRNYFEDPLRLKKVKRYTKYTLLIVIMSIYTIIREEFLKYGMVIPFSKFILILSYIAIINIAIWLITRALTDENQKNNIDDKYMEKLNKEYEKYKLKCEKHNKTQLGWDEFTRKKVKSNFLFTILFAIYAIIFFVFTFLLGKDMLIGNVSIVEFILFIVVCFIGIVMITVVIEGIRRNKQLLSES